MTSNIDALGVRKRLGRDDWGIPSTFGPDGWTIDHLREQARIIITYGPDPTGHDWWLHASISRAERLPDYDDLVLLHFAVWPSGWAYQVFAPRSSHVNIHPNALHLWGHLDGAAVLPDFGSFGTI